MPAGEITGQLLGGVLRIIGNIVIELVVEIVIRGPGYLICRSFKRQVDPDGGCALLVGLLFWLCLALLGYLAYGYFADELTIDRCLDSGGRFDPQNGECTYS